MKGLLSGAAMAALMAGVYRRERHDADGRQERGATVGQMISSGQMSTAAAEQLIMHTGLTLDQAKGGHARPDRRQALAEQLSMASPGRAGPARATRMAGRSGRRCSVTETATARVIVTRTREPGPRVLGKAAQLRRHHGAPGEARPACGRSQGRCCCRS